MKYLVIFIAVGALSLSLFLPSNDENQAMPAEKAPDITLVTPAGKTVQLSKLKGKMVLIDFWASWCGPCRKENPNVVEAYAKYKSAKFKNAKGFEVFSISLDRNEDAWKAAIAQDKLTWKYHGWDKDNVVATLYKVYSIPSAFLVDGDGTIIAQGQELRGTRTPHGVGQSIEKISMVEDQLRSRSNGICELCGGTVGLTAFLVEPGNSTNPDQHVHACSTCVEQMTQNTMDSNHWRCLTESMWSEVPAVQVLSWRMLHRIKSEGWSQDLIDMMYMDDETLTWAQASGDHREVEAAVHHVDSNGTVLENGDTIVLIKDLEVKGAGFTAKRGTSVRNIRLVQDNPEQIEGKINGQGIVILTQYVKK